MADLSNVSKDDIIRFLVSMPGAVSFERWNGAQPTHTDAAALSTWKSAQANPAYDEDIERMLYRSFQQMGPSAQQEYLKNINVAIPPLKFMPEVQNTGQNAWGQSLTGTGKNNQVRVLPMKDHK